ncbi:alpha/beta hydrolase [Ferrimonas lipolytica]|uniref:Alpha/beta hydrolase n=1 Tax=Ferrimonas lipolytica TaxID=2724191 RepID=A0A6H1UHP1_9GAMM|nr:alpha/beta hydrolase [Ferrimonas lipolytica]QIZ78601.1 alpha/beta hydrolase [Ferrimonas lipolytica]
MSAEKWIVRALLAAPTVVQKMVLGEPPLQIEGRIMDLQMQLLSKLARTKPSLDKLSVEHARAAVRTGIAMLASKPDSTVASHDISIEGPESALTVRVYQPQQLDTDAPAILYFHMGGFVVGDLDTNHDFCVTLAKTCGAKVYSVLYRKAPEHPFPAPIDDAFAAHQWLMRNATQQQVDPNRIAIAGDSAGGALTAILCQRLQAESLPQPKVQLMVYPGTSSTEVGSSFEACGNCYPLTMAEMAWFQQHFYASPDDLNHPYSAPMNSQNLQQLAPAIMVTAGFDPLRDQGIAYGNKLSNAGVAVTQIEISGLAHGFTSMAGGINEAKKANLLIAEQLKSLL